MSKLKKCLYLINLLEPMSVRNAMKEIIDNMCGMYASSL